MGVGARGPEFAAIAGVLRRLWLGGRLRRAAFRLLLSVSAVAVSAMVPATALAALPTVYDATDLGANDTSSGTGLEISPNGAYVLIAVAGSAGVAFDHDDVYSTASGARVSLPAGTPQSGASGSAVCPNNRVGQFVGSSVDNSGRVYGSLSETYQLQVATQCAEVPAVTTPAGAASDLTGSGFTDPNLGDCSYPGSYDSTDKYGPSGDVGFATDELGGLSASGNGMALGVAYADCPDPPQGQGGSQYTFIEANGTGSFSEVWNPAESPGPSVELALAGVNDSGTIVAGDCVCGNQAGQPPGVWEWKGKASPTNVLPNDVIASGPGAVINDRGDLLVGTSGGLALYQPSTSTTTTITQPGGSGVGYNTVAALNNNDEVFSITGQPFVWSPTGGPHAITVGNAQSVGISGGLITPVGVGDNGDLVAISGGGSAEDYLLTPAPMVVNSTGNQDDTATDLANGTCNVNLTGPAACTLRAAIEVSNKVGGQPIVFDIPQGNGNTFDGSVPQIQDSGGAGMPVITAPTSIDGTRDPAGRVELSGIVKQNSVTYGLVVGVGGAGSAINGMVINGYQEDIDLRAGGDTVEGNWLGTNPSGSAAEPLPLGAAAQTNLPVAQVGIRVESSGSQLGGPGAGQGNVVASSFGEYGSVGLPPPVTTYGLVGSGDIYDTAGGNVIQGNFIGISPGSGQAPAEGAPLIDRAPRGWTLGEVQLGLVSTGADTIGGSAAGAGNVVAGGGSVGSGSVVQGNTFTDGGLYSANAGRLDVGGFDAAGAVKVGGATTTPGIGLGNTFDAVDPTEPEFIAGDKAVVQGNVFKGDIWGAISLSGQDVTIGGASSDLGNLIESNGANDDPLGTAGIRVVPGGAG